MIYSMTAYANSNLQGEWGSAKWELKSVNHRYLELSIKLPERFRSLEFPLREIIKQKIQRGKLDCWFHFDHSSAQEKGLKCNLPVVKQLAEACSQIQNHFQTQFTLSPLEVLKWPEVLSAEEMDQEKISQDILSSFEKALHLLSEHRASEGAALSKLILDRLQEMSLIIDFIKNKTPEMVKQYREKIMNRLAELKTEINSDRFEQEMIYFLQKIDITEELDRISTHIQSTRDALKKGGTKGRHLDFLMQELNRESNTLASKSFDIHIIQKTVELRVLIEKIREQVQNLE